MYQFAAVVRAGKNGEIRHSGAICLQSWLTQPVWGHWRTDLKWLWRDSTAHGFKGGPGGVGIHILDFATCISGQDVAQVSCLLKVFDKVPGRRIGDYVLDANGSATMRIMLRNGALGTVAATRFASGHHNDLRLRLCRDRDGLEVSFKICVSAVARLSVPLRLRPGMRSDVRPPRWFMSVLPPRSAARGG